jgi:hypothetical protein
VGVSRQVIDHVVAGLQTGLALEPTHKLNKCC